RARRPPWRAASAPGPGQVTAARSAAAAEGRLPTPPLWPAAEWVVAAVGVAIAIVVWAVAPTAGNYDSVLNLVWARELLDGHAPGFEAYAASTPHPAWLALGVPVVAIFGDAGDRVLVLVSALSLPLLAAATVRIGRLLGEALVAGDGDGDRRVRTGLATGLVAGLLTLSSFAFLLLAARGYLDVPFLALVAWAAALILADARQPALRPTFDVGRRTAADGDVGRTPPAAWRRPALLLALAGLLRPEAWVLAGLYWLWCSARGRWAAADDPLPGRLAHLALVVGPPLLWAAIDLAVTGNPLHSLTATSQLAEDLGRQRGLLRAPRVLVSALGGQARPPVAAAGLVGLAVVLFGARIGLARVPRRPLLVVLALLGGGVATFLAAGVGGLSLLPRYLTVPVVAITVLAAVAVSGWMALPPEHRWRRPWALLVVAGIVLGVGGYVALKRDALSRLGNELRFLADTRRDVRQLVDDPRLQAGRRCGPISLPTYRLVPEIRLQLDVDGTRVLARSDPRAERLGVTRGGVAITVAEGKAAQRYGRADGVPRSTQPAPPGFRPVARRGPFVAWVRCGA
uniref:hypothetical protein n=1 Tax=Patulibacter defluvii TaxID=3095358 RepID=UPI002A7573E3